MRGAVPTGGKIMTSRQARRAHWRATALVVALSLLLASCYSRGALEHEAASPDTRPYYCNAVGDGTPPEGHGNGSHVNPAYEELTKGPLSWEDCRELSRQFDLVLNAVKDLPTRGDAEAAGWSDRAGYLPGLGTHHNQGGRPGQEPFDPAKPYYLIYGGMEPDAPLVGVSYSVAATPDDSNPPEGFAGTNDWWHLHQKICYSPDKGVLAGAEEIPDEECTALGGFNANLGDGLWFLHVWLVPPYQTNFDVFVSGHTCMGETGPLPWEDPCWEEFAHHDPADGPLPGSEHDDDHGGDDEHSH